MTLIASFETDGFPILLADILISSSEAPNVALPFPTRGSFDLPLAPDGRMFLTYFKQKIHIVNRNLAVAWAGSYIHAKSVIRDLEEYFSKHEVTDENLDEFFKDDALFENNEFVLNYIDDEDRLRSGGVNVAPFKTAQYGECFLGGTGRGFLEERLHLEASEFSLIGDHSQYNRAIARALQVSGSMLAEELSTGNNLEFYCGGGTEIAHASKDGFKKLDDILYVFINVDASGKEIPYDLAPTFIKAKYVEEFLLLYALEFDVKGPDIKRQMAFVVPPVVGARPRSSYPNFPLPDWDASYMCSAVSVKRNEERYFLGLVNYSPERKLPMRIRRSGDMYLLEAKDGFLDTIHDSLMAKLHSEI